MTPEEKTELELVKRQLADAKGRIQAVELHSREIERAAKIATDQAEALKAETEAALSTAADQMKVAHAISSAVFGMTEISRAFMARKITAARCTHREANLFDKLAKLVEAIDKGDTANVKTIADSCKGILSILKNDSEANRNAFHEHFLAMGYTHFDKVFDLLMTGEK